MDIVTNNQVTRKISSAGDSQGQPFSAGIIRPQSLNLGAKNAI